VEYDNEILWIITIKWCSHAWLWGWI